MTAEAEIRRLIEVTERDLNEARNFDREWLKGRLSGLRSALDAVENS